MAVELVSKTKMVLSPGNTCCVHHHNHLRRVSVFPSKSTKISGATGFPSLKIKSLGLRSSSSSFDFTGRRVVVGGLQAMTNKGEYTNTQAAASNAKMSIGIAKAQRWWEKGLQPNMKEVDGAQDLVDSLLEAGDKLVVVDFFSPGCGGCKALHPKICQLAEMNPDVQFLQVNYEEHKSMCYSLNVHVLPFFRFYRGAHGRLCSFSCTNATIKKFKDALAKHKPDRCSLGAPKGLEEKELLALSANKDLSFSYKPKPEEPGVPAEEKILLEAAAASNTNASETTQLPLLHPLPPVGSKTASKAAQETENKKLISSGR